MKQNNCRSCPRGALKWGLKGGGLIRGVMIFLLLVGMFAGILGQPLRTAAADPSQKSEEDEIPNDIKEYCETIGAEFNICPELLEAICYQESRFDPEVKQKNYYGLMQINVKVHKERIAKYGWTSDDMFDPEKNITVGADFLAELFDLFGDDDYIVLAFYSGGWKAVDKYKEYGFLSEYVTNILDRSAKYERLHGK